MPKKKTTKNKKTYRERVLGMRWGAANHHLKRKILREFFRLTVGLKCYRCGEVIRSHESFDVDHKDGWLLSENPVEAFFDLENISCSHSSCNRREGQRVGEALRRANCAEDND